jgi:hypothetical protein
MDGDDGRESLLSAKVEAEHDDLHEDTSEATPRCTIPSAKAVIDSSFVGTDAERRSWLTSIFLAGLAAVLSAVYFGNQLTNAPLSSSSFVATADESSSVNLWLIPNVVFQDTLWRLGGPGDMFAPCAPEFGVDTGCTSSRELQLAFQSMKQKALPVGHCTSYNPNAPNGPPYAFSSAPCCYNNGNPKRFGCDDVPDYTVQSCADNLPSSNQSVDLGQFKVCKACTINCGLCADPTGDQHTPASLWHDMYFENRTDPNHPHYCAALQDSQRTVEDNVKNTEIWFSSGLTFNNTCGEKGSEFYCAEDQFQLVIQVPLEWEYFNTTIGGDTYTKANKKASTGKYSIAITKLELPFASRTYGYTNYIPHDSHKCHLVYATGYWGYGPSYNGMKAELVDCKKWATPKPGIYFTSTQFTAGLSTVTIPSKTFMPWYITSQREMISSLRRVGSPWSSEVPWTIIADSSDKMDSQSIKEMISNAYNTQGSDELLGGRAMTSLLRVFESIAVMVKDSAQFHWGSNSKVTFRTRVNTTHSRYVWEGPQEVRHTKATVSSITASNTEPLPTRRGGNPISFSPFQLVGIRFEVDLDVDNTVNVFQFTALNALAQLSSIVNTLAAAVAFAFPSVVRTLTYRKYSKIDKDLSAAVHEMAGAGANSVESTRPSSLS